MVMSSPTLPNRFIKMQRNIQKYHKLSADVGYGVQNHQDWVGLTIFDVNFQLVFRFGTQLSINQQTHLTTMNRYRLIQRVGNGGYSQVYKAFDNVTGKVCALKVMKHRYQSCSASHDHELMTLRKFSGCPAIVRLIDSFVEDGHLAMVFEMCQLSLIEFYKTVRESQQRPLLERQICSIMLQMCLAIDTLHRQGYAHRDIKSENVMIQRRNGLIQAKLVDFGLAKLMNKDQNTNYIATRWYRAPELLMSMPYDRSIDVFALGCVMAELYAGIQPFRGLNTIDQLTQIFNVLGEPSVSTWPEGVCRLAGMGVMVKHQRPLGLRNLVPNASNEALDLLGQMLVLNPKLRIRIGDVLRHPYFSSSRHSLPPELEEQFNFRVMQFQNPQCIPDKPKQMRIGYSEPKLRGYSKDTMNKTLQGPALQRPLSFYQPKQKTNVSASKFPEPNFLENRFQSIRSPNHYGLIKLRERENKDASAGPLKNHCQNPNESRTLIESDLIRAKLRSLGEGTLYKNSYLKKRTQAQNVQKQFVSRYNTQPFNQTNISLQKYKSVNTTTTNRQQHCFNFPEEQSNSKQMLSLARISIKNPPAIPNIETGPLSEPINLNLSKSINLKTIYPNKVTDPLAATARVKVNRILQGFHRNDCHK